MNKKMKSPLKMAPLRVPGQSLDSEIDTQLHDGMLFPLTMVLVFMILAGWEWFRYFVPNKPQPMIVSLVFVGVVCWAAWRARRAYLHVVDLKLGRDGERAVGQYLERFRVDSFIFHDVPNGEANIDHVLIGPRGLYTIETKTMRKPERGECRIKWVEGRLYANGRQLERDAAVQAKAQARWLNQFYAEAGFKAFVQPVVVFPGWFVEPFDMKAAGVWVLEPKALDAFIGGEPERLSHDEVKALSLALSAYIRAQAKV